MENGKTENNWFGTGSLPKKNIMVVCSSLVGIPDPIFPTLSRPFTLIHCLTTTFRIVLGMLAGIDVVSQADRLTSLR